MKTCTVDNNGFRITAGFKRTGRPRIKWYDQVMNSCFDRLVKIEFAITKLERGYQR